MNGYYKVFGKNWFKALLSDLNVSKIHFSQAMGIPYYTVVSWEKGQRVPPEYVMDLIVYKIYKENLFNIDKSIDK